MGMDTYFEWALQQTKKFNMNQQEIPHPLQVEG